MSIITEIIYYFLLIPIIATAGFVADIIFGDPRWFPHPVKAVAGLSGFIHRKLKNRKNPKISGALMVSAVIISVFCMTAFLTFGLDVLVGMIIGSIFSVILFYTSVAIKDLRGHALEVHRSLDEGDIKKAREKLAMIVGRDTRDLKTGEIIRATIESISENSVDGIFSPLFYGFLLGAPGAVTFKAVSTLDSLYGYKDKGLKRFGWASARTDDFLNFIPARLSIMIFIFTAFVYNRSAGRAMRIISRDRKKHESPNSAIGEAAVAAILGIRLGGPSHYQGKLYRREQIGDDILKIEKVHILQAINVIYIFSFSSLAFFLLIYLPVMLVFSRVI